MVEDVVVQDTALVLFEVIMGVRIERQGGRPVVVLKCCHGRRDLRWWWWWWWGKGSEVRICVWWWWRWAGGEAMKINKRRNRR